MQALTLGLFNQPYIRITQWTQSPPTTPSSSSSSSFLSLSSSCVFSPEVEKLVDQLTEECIVRRKTIGGEASPQLQVGCGSGKEPFRSWEILCSHKTQQLKIGKSWCFLENCTGKDPSDIALWARVNRIGAAHGQRK